MPHEELTMSAGYAGSPNTKYLYYPQGMEDITLKDRLLPASINQELIIRSLIIYRNLIPLLRYLMKNNPTLSVDNPGPQEIKYLHYLQHTEGINLKASL